MKILIVDDAKLKDQCLNLAGLLSYQEDPGIFMVENYDDAIDAISTMGPWSYLLLDHDLSETKTGYDILVWFEQEPETRLQLLPKTIICISYNPVGKERIENLTHKLMQWKHALKAQQGK